MNQKRINPFIEKQAKKIKNWFRDREIADRNFRDMQEKYDKIMKIYVWCLGHNNLVHRRTGMPAPEQIWDWATAFLQEFGQEKSHGYCEPCFEIEKIKINASSQEDD